MSNTPAYFNQFPDPIMPKEGPAFPDSDVTPSDVTVSPPDPDYLSTEDILGDDLPFVGPIV
jgi:hypothetical protein